MGVIGAFIGNRAKSFLPSLRHLLADDSGQAITEYILILAITVGVTATFSRKIIAGLNKGVQSLAAVLERQLKTGRMSIGYWKN